jgi:DNA-3-methyladenine glycosylase I
MNARERRERAARTERANEAARERAGGEVRGAQPVRDARERREPAARTERADEAARERARGGVRGAQPLGKERCSWARTPLSIAYHDREWGRPVHDDIVLFEFITLEGAQAGLSWETILNKRDAYREAFAGFDPAKVARFTPARVERLMANPGIVRNRLKIESTIGNARAFLNVQKEFGSFDKYLWTFVGGTPKINRPRTLGDVPTRTPESDALSKDLQKRGFKFVGTTIMYAFMQAVGMVDDHLVTCFRAGSSQSK